MRTTIVEGRILMRDRELLTIDVPAVVQAMGERMPTLLDRSRQADPGLRHVTFQRG